MPNIGATFGREIDKSTGLEYLYVGMYTKFNVDFSGPAQTFPAGTILTKASAAYFSREMKMAQFKNGQHRRL